jgi:hypothetical protein
MKVLIMSINKFFPINCTDFTKKYCFVGNLEIEPSGYRPRVLLFTLFITYMLIIPYITDIATQIQKI